MKPGTKTTPGGNPLSRYKHGDRSPECVKAYNAYMKIYMRGVRQRKASVKLQGELIRELAQAVVADHREETT